MELGTKILFNYGWLPLSALIAYSYKYYLVNHVQPNARSWCESLANGRKKLFNILNTFFLFVLDKEETPLAPLIERLTTYVIV